MDASQFKRKKIFRALNQSVKPFRPKARAWVIQYKSYFPSIVATLTFIAFVGFVLWMSAQHQARPAKPSDFGILFICCFVVGFSLYQHFEMRSLSFLSKGLKADVLFRKNRAHAQLNTPVDNFAAMIKSHHFAQHLLRTQEFREALLRWMEENDTIGTYEVAVLEHTYHSWRTLNQREHYADWVDIETQPRQDVDMLWQELESLSQKKLLNQQTPRIDNGLSRPRRL